VKTTLWGAYFTGIYPVEWGFYSTGAKETTEIRKTRQTKIDEILLTIVYNKDSFCIYKRAEAYHEDFG
jgi:hypothetical protein